jgi:hypothetical protein
MCYILVKNVNKRGCIALKTRHGKKLVELKRKLEDMADKDTQVVLISRPSAYGEYSPYAFAESEEELFDNLNCSLAH